MELLCRYICWIKRAQVCFHLASVTSQADTDINTSNSTRFDPCFDSYALFSILSAKVRLNFCRIFSICVCKNYDLSQ